MLPPQYSLAYFILLPSTYFFSCSLLPLNVNVAREEFGNFAEAMLGSSYTNSFFTTEEVLVLPSSPSTTEACGINP